MSRDITIAIAVGVFSGILSWWITARAITPQIVLSTKISKQPALEGEPGQWRYRFKVQNKRRWYLPAYPAVELDIAAYVVFKSLRSKAPHSIDRVRVPVGAGTSDEADLEISYLPTNRALRLRTEAIKSTLIPKQMRDALCSAE